MIALDALVDGELHELEADIDGEAESLIVLRTGDSVRAWRNICPHAGRRLDWAPGQFLRAKDGSLVCAVHGATFALADGRCTLKGPMMRGVTVQLGPSACLDVDGVLVAVVSGKKQLLDRELLRMVGIVPEAMRLIVVKSSNHFRADFTPIASRVLVAKAAGPMAADPGDLPWKHLGADVRTRP